MMRTQHRDNQTLVLTEVSDISSDTSDAQRLLDVVNLAVEHGTCLIVLTNKPVWNTLQRHGLIVSLDLPGEDEMYDIVKRFIDDYRQEMPLNGAKRKCVMRRQRWPVLPRSKQKMSWPLSSPMEKSAMKTWPKCGLPKPPLFQYSGLEKSMLILI